MTYTVVDYTGDKVKFNSLRVAYHFMRDNIANLLKLDNVEVDTDRLYADMQEFYESGFSPEKTPWIKEGDCWLSDLYSVYQEKQIL